MTASKQCLEVINGCDFPDESYMWVERLCLKWTPKQIIGLVWNKDKKGVHDWDWFDPFFASGYVPIIKPSNHVNMDDSFWKTYIVICSFVDPFSVDQLGLIDIMKKDTFRVKQAIQKSKPNILYLFKVWEGMETTETVSINNAQMIEIKKHEVNLSEFD